MALYSEGDKEYQKERIRKILVYAPNATGKLIQIRLKKPDSEELESLDLSQEYCVKLKNEIRKENAESMRKETIEEEVSKFQAIVDEMVEELRKMIVNPMVKPKDRNTSIRNLVEAYKTLTNMKFDAGFFAKKLGELDINDKNGSPDKQREQIQRVLNELNKQKPDTDK